MSTVLQGGAPAPSASPPLPTPTAPSGEQHWRSLRLYCAYRVVQALVFSGLGGWHAWLDAAQPAASTLQFLALALSYLGLAVGFAALARDPRVPFHGQLTSQVLVDAVVITSLGYLAGGLGSGLPLMILVALAGAGLIARGRLVLSYAAFASLVLLAAQTLAVLEGLRPAAEYLQAGLLCVACFAVALATHRLSRLARVSEALVRQQAVDLADLSQLNQAVLHAMQDALLVVDAHGVIRLANPRAQELLGPEPPVPGGVTLQAWCPGLQARLDQWLARADRASGAAGAGTASAASAATGTVRSAFSGRELQPRFSGIGGDLRFGVSVLLEDVTGEQEQARQGKLAALGRLTANIAHEIRNPLAAISHAAELLSEDHPRDPVEQKLVRIIHDNTQRLNSLVNDVLQLSRRDRAVAEPIEIDRWLPAWCDEFATNEGMPRDWLTLESAPGLQLLFDRNHFHQVLWNLVRNAQRHCRQQAGSIRLCVERAPGDRGVQFDVLDDGPGVPPDLVGELFEPFFTTASQGTGLGLYIARELCVANGATLEYVEDAPGAQFRLMLREP